MFFLSHWKLIGSVVLLASLTGALFLFKQHYDTLVLERDQYKTGFAVSEQAHKITKESFAFYRSETEQQLELLQKHLDELQSEYGAAQEEVDVLIKKLSKHNLTLLATKKPGLVSSRINAGTARLFRDLEQATAPD